MANVIEGWLTVNEVARRMGVSRITVGNWCRGGLLEARQVTRRLWLIREECLMNFQRPLVGNPTFRKENPRKRKRQPA